MTVWEAPGKSDEWYTPRYVFDALGETFDLDVSAAPPGCGSVPAKQGLRELALLQPWHGFIWMNPPFGGNNGVDGWIERFMAHGNGIALLPDRTSARWFQRIAHEADAILFLSPRIRYELPDGTRGDNISPTGAALFAMGERATVALQRGKSLGVMLVHP